MVTFTDRTGKEISLHTPGDVVWYYPTERPVHAWERMENGEPYQVTILECFPGQDKNIWYRFEALQSVWHKVTQDRHARFSTRPDALTARK